MTESGRPLHEEGNCNRPETAKMEGKKYGQNMKHYCDYAELI